MGRYVRKCLAISRWWGPYRKFALFQAVGQRQLKVYRSAKRKKLGLGSREPKRRRLSGNSDRSPESSRRSSGASRQSVSGSDDPAGVAVAGGVGGPDRGGRSCRPASLGRSRKGVACEDSVLDLWRRTTKLHEVVKIGPRNAQVTCASIQSLSGNAWVNDEVINFYLRLVQVRANREERRLAILSSFFFTQLTSPGGKYCYGNVRRWTKKDQPLTKDTIMMPINIAQQHWVLVAIRLKHGRIELYDSMYRGKYSNSILPSVEKWIRDEQADKQIDLPVSSWRYESMDVCIQDDACSCGVFTCVFAERLAAGFCAPFDISKDDIKELRLGIAADILACSL